MNSTAETHVRTSTPNHPCEHANGRLVPVAGTDENAAKRYALLCSGCGLIVSMVQL